MTYQPDFRSVRAKIERAKEHRDILEREIQDAFEVESNRVGLRVEFDPESGYHVFRARTFPPEDLLVRFGLILGDALQNLRAALDHLVWQLSLHKRNGRSPRNPTTVDFPSRVHPSPTLDQRILWPGRSKPCGTCSRAIGQSSRTISLTSDGTVFLSLIPSSDSRSSPTTTNTGW